MDETESGIYNVVKLAKSPRPYDPIDVNEFGRSRFVILSPLKQSEPMLINEFGSVTEDSFEHFRKELFPSEDIPSGMSIFVKLPHPDKALAPNDV